MTVHRSKGGEWERVFIINPDEFPHPKAKSDRQKQQETNLMYVAVTRAINNLYFVGEPFACLTVSGYEPAQPVTSISFPSANHLEIHAGHQDDSTSVPDNIIDIATLRSKENEASIESIPQKLQELTKPTSTIVEAPEAGKISRVLAIEVLCPSCNSACVDAAIGSLSITENLIGHTVVCSSCRKACIVPLNAFSLQGEVIAREKPTAGVPNSKIEKKGRTKKERKSNAGRKAKGATVRQPLQLSLDIRTIDTLNAMRVNKSELFEELLKQYDPFLLAWSELDNEFHKENEIED
jgi:UvrD-like helicase C-terminal domain